MRLASRTLRRLLKALQILVCFLPAATQAEAPFEVELLTGNPAGLIAPGQEKQLGLLIKNTSTQAATAEFKATVTEFDGVKQSLAQKLSLPARGKVRLDVPLDVRRRGVRTVDYEIRGGDGVSSGKRSFVYARPAGPGRDPAGFYYGVCGHLERVSIAEAQREITAASQIGISVMRLGEEWASLEKQRGDWHWTDLDARVKLLSASGMKAQMLLGYGNAFAASPDAFVAQARAKLAEEPEPWRYVYRAVPENAAWRQYVSRVATRYRGKVTLYEVWNEPDLDYFFPGSTEDYIQLLRSAYSELKKADPKAVVMTAGFATAAPHPWRKLNPDLQQRVLVEANDSFDVHAYHEHSGFKWFAGVVDGELARMRAKMPKPRPLYFNETGLESSYGAEREQALALAKKVVFSRARGAIGYNWYDLRDDGTDAGEKEHNYGLLTRSFQPKPSYAVYNELIARLRGSKAGGAIRLGADNYGFVFLAGSRQVLVLWTEATRLADETITLSTDASSATLITLMGNESALPVRQGVFSLPLRSEPVYVELPLAKALPRLVTPAHN